MSKAVVCCESVGDVVKKASSYLRGMKVTSGYRTYCRRLWGEFVDFAGSPETAFSEELRQRFLESLGFARDDWHRAIDVGRRHPRSVTRILSKMHRFGSFRHSNTIPVPRLPAWLRQAWKSHERFCRQQKGLSESSIQRHYQHLVRFFSFLKSEDCKSWSDLCPSLFTRFFKTLESCKHTTRKGYAGTLRSFFRSLHCLGIAARDWAAYMPSFAPKKDAGITFIWSREEIDRLLGAIDRGTKTGRRNYAFILMAARLGMRSSDLRGLRLEDLCWEENTIRFLQQKTGKSHALPLTAEVGSALISYLSSGRPVSDSREVFLSHNSPYAPMGRTSMSGVLREARKHAGIAKPDNRRASMHSFRFSLATHLLEDGVSWGTISSVMGHSNPDSTQTYAKASVQLLRGVALDTEEVSHA